MSPGLQSLPTTRRVSQSSAGLGMLQLVPFVRAFSLPDISKVFAKKKTIADASREPDYFSNITRSVPANGSSFLVDLMTFQEYSPCVFILEDLQFNYSTVPGLTKNNVYAAFSNLFAISVQNHSAGVTWSADNPAPEQNGTDGIGGGASKSIAGHIVPMAHASLIGAILVALMV